MNEQRLCEECKEPLSLARLKAMPEATLCVPCKVAVGDEERLRRHDDFNKDCEVINETYFKPSERPDLAIHINRLSSSFSVSTIEYTPGLKSY